MFDGLELPPFSANQDKRNYEETKMFLEEIKLRYPITLPKDSFVKQVITKLNQNSINTFQTIRQAITSQEVAQGLPNTEPPVPLPVSNKQLFSQLLTQRRYKWKGGTSPAFKNWISGLSPLEHPLPIDAEINCWEAVLFSAAQAGLVTREQLQVSYDEQDIAKGVYYMITQKLTREINHPNPVIKNDIQAGDIIMLEVEVDPDRVHHVVVALEAYPLDYNNVTVMSLIGGEGFTKTTLVMFLLPGRKTTIRYTRL